MTHTELLSRLADSGFTIVSDAGAQHARKDWGAAGWAVVTFADGRVMLQERNGSYWAGERITLFDAAAVEHILFHYVA